MTPEEEERIITDQADRIEQLLENLKPKAREELIKIFKSGAIDLEKFDFRNSEFVYPKMILTLYLRQEPFSLPKDSSWEKEFRHLKKWI